MGCNSTGDIPMEEVMDKMWGLNTAFLVFFIQAGFCMFEVGFVRNKSTRAIVVKHFIGIVGGTAVYWAVGYALAFGSSVDGFFGFSDFLLISGCYDSYLTWAFHWSYFTTATTIITGAMAERTAPTVCALYTILANALILPVYAHWIWNKNGLLCRIGVADSSGVSAHILGGCIGLVGTSKLGSRLGIFEEPKPAPHNIIFSTLGTFMLWYGFYGITTGASHDITREERNINTALKIAVNVTLSSIASCLFALILMKFKSGTYDILTMLNSVLAGLVSIIASSPFVVPWEAFLIGMIGAFAYMGCSRLLLASRIDDPLESCSVHLGAGAWGLLAVGIFSDQIVIPHAECSRNYGLIHGGGLWQLLYQLIGLGAALAWSGILAAVLFSILDKFKVLHVGLQYDSEEQGIDNIHELTPLVNN